MLKIYSAPFNVEEPRSETDADFTFKDNYYKDADGKTKVKRTKYFGFRTHVLADVNYELPIEYTVTKASKSERSELKNHINMLPNEIREKIVTLSADKGYDGKPVIDFLIKNGISPVIDICNHWEKGEDTRQYKDTNIIYTYDGKVSIVLDNGNIEPLKYLGYDKVKNKLRYGYKDKVYSIDVNYDTRVFTPIARDSKKWKRIYNKRTALERINGRLDRDFNLENNKVRGFIINMDIIVGLPDETTEDVLFTLNELEKFDIENLTIHTLAFKRASNLFKESQERVELNGEVITEAIGKLVKKKEMNPYYLYRQKNIMEWGENIGYSKLGCESVFNIEMIEENQSTMGLGGGAITKIVIPETEYRDYIERYVNPKDPALYIREMEERMGAKKELFLKLKNKK